MDMRRIRRRCAALLLALLTAAALPAGALEDTAYDYILDGGVRRPIPKTYRHVRTIQSLGGEYGSFDGVQDLFVDGADNLYIVDTGNNRVVKTTTGFEVLAVYAGSEEDPLGHPEGVFVDTDLSLYIADTQNSRILHLAPDGRTIEAFGVPESAYLGEGFVYNPRKVAVTSTGYLYTMKGKQLLRIDANNEFKGYVGANKVGFSLKNLLIRLFASQEQKDKLVKAEAAAYTNFILGEDNYLYASTADLAGGQLKKLNSVGENILPVQPYGERAVKTGGGEADPVFADLTVDARGILTAIDSVSARVYQYDPAGNLLTVFGGKGSGKGYLSSPRAIAQDSGGSLYIYDANLNTIQVYRPTAFLESVHRAVALYDGGEYDKAQAAWEEVLSTGGSYSLAYIGLGDACYKNEAYEEAMEHYYTARDEAGYAKAFSKYRYRWFKENFLWAVLAAAAIAAAFLTAGRLLIRLSARFERLYLSTINEKRTDGKEGK